MDPEQNIDIKNNEVANRAVNNAHGKKFFDSAEFFMNKDDIQAKHQQQLQQKYLAAQQSQNGGVPNQQK